MVDTIRTLADLQALLGDNIIGDISAQDVRDLLVSSVPTARTTSFAENSGTVTILSGTTSIVVTHGLSVTPTLRDISVVAGEDPTNSVGLIWVDTITSTQFTIHCEANPGASNLDVGWRVVVL